MTSEPQHDTSADFRAGLLLVGATLVALVWASSPWQVSYTSFWEGDLDLRHWVDDGLMTLFFFVIGLEIKQELVAGELRTPARAALPVVGALGGMVVPAALYLAVAGGGPVRDGWGIPMATDVAFAIGVLALLGDRVPRELKVLLLALAIVDDVGAILVIAVAYADSVQATWLVAGLVGLAAVAVLFRLGVRWWPGFVVLAGAVWWATYQSGVHATIAGVALALVVPVPVAERLRTLLQPWTSWLVIPLFALANAGIDLAPSRLSDAASSSVTRAVVVGLVVGKVVGVVGAIAGARALGLITLPPTLGLRHLAGLGLAAGVGFTVSIFVTALAFEDPRLIEDAKVGVLIASMIAAVAATVVLRGGDRAEPGC